MKVDLDELVRKASAATHGPWRCEIGSFSAGNGNILTNAPITESWCGPQYTAICCSHLFYARHAADFEHIAANDPSTTLALIDYIRELEAMTASLAVAASAAGYAYEAGLAQEILARGVVLT